MLRLLVVDDEPDIRSTLGEGLGIVLPQPATVLTASSAAEAQALLASGGPVDLILCDQRMPGMTGLALLAWMRAEGMPTKRVLLTALNAAALPPDELTAAEPHAVCTKPIRLETLASLVQAVLRSPASAGGPVAPTTMPNHGPQIAPPGAAPQVWAAR